ncbi:MAG: GIY-YIG nuclease family protein [Candidatus Aureabacteria bacterium]|nr:GIY-YIG nuclease family protein [Candidatus Auribacterota bacterium]
MYYVYILYCFKNKRLYTGFSSNLRKRVKEHSQGKSPYTKIRRPIKLVYYEAHLSKKDAQRREKYLKTAKGKSSIKQMLRDTIQNINTHKSL